MKQYTSTYYAAWQAQARPIGLGQGLVHLAGYGSHEGDGVEFARAEGV